MKKSFLYNPLKFFLLAALRNGVLSRLDTALRVSKEAVNSVEMFARKYLFDDGSNVSWIDREFHNHPALKSLSEKSPIAFGVVSRLHEDMENLLNAFSQASDLIWESRFRDAHILSTSILRRAAGFHEFAIAEMRLKATCTHVHAHMHTCVVYVYHICWFMCSVCLPYMLGRVQCMSTLYDGSCSMYFCMLVAGCRLLVAGSWLLAAGCWWLVAAAGCCWLLAAGCGYVVLPIEQILILNC